MRYEMKQKLFAWGDDFVIRDEQGNDAFFVDGKVFSLGHQLSLQDMHGREVAFIKQKLLSWGSTYEVSRNDRILAIVKKELFTFFNCRFEIDVPGPNDLTASGDFTDHDYTIQRGDDVVATISKEWFTFADSYGVDIGQGEDAGLILACTVVIDMACHQK